MDKTQVPCINHKENTNINLESRASLNAHVNMSIYEDIEVIFFYNILFQCFGISRQGSLVPHTATAPSFTGISLEGPYNIGLEDVV